MITSGLDGAARASSAGLLPPARHAAGRPELLRHRRARPRPGRHVRRPATRRRAGGPGRAVRRDGHRAAGAAFPARHRHLLVRLARRQVRRVRQRPADVVGAGPGHQAGRAVPGVVRQPAQVRPHRAPRRRHDAGPHRARGTLGGRAARGRLAHRRGGHARWSPGRRCSSRPASSPPATSASCWTRPRCWPASRCRRAAGSPSCPTPAAPGVLAADACTDAGLHVATLGGQAQDELRRLLPPGASVTGPVDTTAAVPARCLPPLPGTGRSRRWRGRASWCSPCPPPSPTWPPRRARRTIAKPLVAVGAQPGRNGPAAAGPPVGPGPVPAYAYPASAARALAHAAGTAPGGPAARPRPRVR